MGVASAIIHLDPEAAEYWQCPLCLSSHWGSRGDRIHQAAHCCLWKFIGHSDRVRIAEMVEAGSEWQEAIEEFAHVVRS